MKTFVKFFIKGGILGLTDLERIVEVHDKLSGDHFQFTDRQEVLIRISSAKAHMVASLAGILKFEIADKNGEFKYQNIVSSFLSKKIDQSTYWLKQGVYLEILDQVSRLYKHRINITDLKQDFVYSFTGDINFVASDEVNYWYLYIRDVDKQRHRLVPFLIYSEDVIAVADYLEDNFVQGETKVSRMKIELQELVGARGQSFAVEPRVSVSEYNNYEGLHFYGEDKFWMGIYKRNGNYSTYLLNSLIAISRSQMIGQVHITPWKSVIVKEIDSFSLTDWKLFLTEHNINTGHSEAELNWQLQNFDEDALQIKTFLRKEFASKDMNINGAIFGVNVDRKTTFAHILIKKNTYLKFMGRNEVSTYTVFYRENFSPISTTFKTFNKNVLKPNLSKVIKEVIKMYHEKAYKEVASFVPKPVTQAEELETIDIKEVKVFRCKDCFTVYYPEFGDSAIEPGTSFNELPEDYCCSICDAPKSSYEEVNASIFS